MADFGQELKGVPQPPNSGIVPSGYNKRQADDGLRRKKKPTIFGLITPAPPPIRRKKKKTVFFGAVKVPKPAGYKKPSTRRAKMQGPKVRRGFYGKKFGPKKPPKFGPRKPRKKRTSRARKPRERKQRKGTRSSSRSFSRPKKSWLLKKFVTILKKAARSKRSAGYKRARLRGT